MTSLLRDLDTLRPIVASPFRLSMATNGHDVMRWRSRRLDRASEFPRCVRFFR
ncbi:hypothetical protein ACFYV7_25115 [Nocardia suismassiliense]|uniref:Uncharacterized protein n=1 Tax=Nocardia suismassiliense TaxID=2077092 RepID=A0ABW6QXY2_9NOCA